MKKKKSTKGDSQKISDLAKNSASGNGQFLTTNQGLKINDNQNSLKAGSRGSTLLEDFILREKITHFDHERIPERIVHARGSAAHGYFQVYQSMGKYTKAAFLQNPGEKTPVFVRFSTVAGSRGSTDLARDVRGFAVKFYTTEGIFDLVGNNMPVFFIQDAIKFPDLIHAVKPEPDNEMPQAASAHDTFWDFISLMPESMHMIMWVMSDRAIPRSYRMMEGFGVHTFRFINEKGRSVFVKFHWKPVLGVHSVVWDEAQVISGKDPDFHKRDLFENIESGNFPEWELGVQIVEEKDEFKFSFDLLDPTKLIPEEIVPVKIIGKLTLNRNPGNFFAETEQVAFHPGHIVPGIDFTNDPLLQGRLFSYTDTQLSRLGSPNFHEIPINRPISPVNNNQRDGHMRQTIVTDKTSYDPNTLGGGCPFQAKAVEGGFTSYTERIDAKKVRERSESFFDHFSQARLFYNSQSQPEKDHLILALTFELGKLKTPAIQNRMLGLLSLVEKDLAAKVADGLGLKVPAPESPVNRSIPADGNPKDFQPVNVNPEIDNSPALSMADTIKKTDTRKIAILASDGVDDRSITSVISAVKKAKAVPVVIAPHLGNIISQNGSQIKTQESFLTASSVLFDAVFVPGGAKSIETLTGIPEAAEFINQAYKHFKPIGANKEAIELIKLTDIVARFHKEVNAEDLFAEGILINKSTDDFIRNVAKHRFWNRKVS
ncbi:MAG: catalase [Ignavibacteria bacterium]|nr:catalase [Ignavibacteria bacterium]